MCRKYLGKISVTNLSGSLTIKASPLGNQQTMFWSSLRSISISFRGNGLEWPVLWPLPLPLPVPGLDAADNAGDTDGSRVDVLCDRRDPDDVLGLVDKVFPPGLSVTPGCILITPAAIPPETGTRIAGGGGIPCGGGGGAAAGECCC